jgi:mevalonate kinase
MKTDDNERTIALKLARRAYAKKYREAHKEKVLETNRNYLHKNKEIYNKKQAVYRKENCEKLKQQRREWHKNNRKNVLSETVLDEAEKKKNIRKYILKPVGL